MKQFFLIFLCLNAIGITKLKSQVFTLTFRGEKLNFIDSSGLEQGKWIEFKQNDTNRLLNYRTGFYKDGVRIGKWEIHAWHGDYGGEYFVNYDDNGFFTIDLSYYQRWNILYDSSLMYRFYYVNKKPFLKAYAIRTGIDEYDVVIYNENRAISRRASKESFLGVLKYY